MTEDHTKKILNNLLSLLNIKITPATLLTDMQKHLVPGRGLILDTCNLLNGWNIDARYIALDFDMLGEVPLPCIVFLHRNQAEKINGYFVILTQVGEND